MRLAPLARALLRQSPEQLLNLAVSALQERSYPTDRPGGGARQHRRGLTKFHRERKIVSLRALRRSAIAAISVLAAGGTLAIASTASAASIPFGTPISNGDASVYGLLNTSYAGLKSADQALYVATGGTDTAVPSYSSFPSETTAGTSATTTQLTSAQALQIAADFSDTTVTDSTTTKSPSANYYTAIKTYVYGGGSSAYATASAQVVAAAEGWSQLSQLVDNLYNDDAPDFPGNPLFSIDGDLTYSASATVKSTGIPNAYSVSLATSGAATSGYVLPSTFTLTLPGDFSLNATLAGRELTTTQEASPVAADAIGTFSLVSPASESFALSTTDKITGSVYVVDFPKATDPSLELYLGNEVYMLGGFSSSGLSFPLTLTFDGVNASALGLSATEALPLQSIFMAFPAASSPVNASSCSNLGTVTGTATDEVAGLAASLSGDTTDGYFATGNTPVAIPGINTVVTDECAASGSKGTLSVSKKTGKGTLSLKVTGNGGTKFKSVTIKFPSGVTDKGKKSATVKFGATASKTIKLTGLKLTKKETKAKSFKVSFTVVYSENSTTAVSTAATAKLKK